MRKKIGLSMGCLVLSVIVPWSPAAMAQPSQPPAPDSTASAEMPSDEPLPPPPPPSAPQPPPALHVQPVRPLPGAGERPAVCGPFIRILTLGLGGDVTLYRDGGMSGANMWAQLRLNSMLQMYTSLGLLVSCSTCNKEGLRRTDLRWSLGLQFYPYVGGWVVPYLRGAMLYQFVTFMEPNPREEMNDRFKTHQLGGEIATGFELRFLPKGRLARLALMGEVSYIALGHADRRSRIVDDPGKGTPAASRRSQGVNFRFGLGVRY